MATFVFRSGPGLCRPCRGHKSQQREGLGTSPSNMTLSAYFWSQTHPTLSKDLDTGKYTQTTGL